MDKRGQQWGLHQSLPLMAWALLLAAVATGSHALAWLPTSSKVPAISPSSLPAPTPLSPLPSSFCSATHRALHIRGQYPITQLDPSFSLRLLILKLAGADSFLQLTDWYRSPVSTLTVLYTLPSWHLSHLQLRNCLTSGMQLASALDS